MCGIAGFIYKNNTKLETVDKVASMILEKLHHRGPDDRGIWHDREDRVLFAHRRLSILDLSTAGAQPMFSADRRYVMVYNGEVYNAPELSSELKKNGTVFRGHSDTELMLEMIVRYGVRDAVKHFNGMFAFALWDTQEEKLYLVRDRLGVKPLYYGRAKDGTFLFGSELKALTLWPEFNGTLDMNALGQYFRHNYIPGPLSIYKSIKKLLPGHIMEIKDGRDNLYKYWDPVDVFNSSRESRNSRVDEAEAIEKLDALLFDSVRMRMLSDVPLGAFLSGGIDSSAVVSMMCRANHGKVNTFSIGFAEESFNESHYAKAVAEHLGTEHTELFVTAEEALKFIPEIPEVWDEPFADSSQIPTYFLSKLTRNYVTVSLSGDGGDEFFHGYPRYKTAEEFYRKFRGVPFPVKKLSALFRKIPPPLLNSLDELIYPVLSLLAKPKYPCRLLYRGLELLSTENENEFYGWMISHQIPPGGILRDGYDDISDLFNETYFLKTGDMIDKFSMLDIKSYLPDDILVKVDRASMAVSLEARTPLLDYRFAEYSLSLPPAVKEDKKILKQVLYKYVPEKLMDRPKMGFGIPLGEWLSGPLREWSEELLSEKNLAANNILNVKNVRKVWKEHLNGIFNHQYILWNILMFQAWLKKWK